MEHIITLTGGSLPITVEMHEPKGTPKGLVLLAYGSDGLTDDLSGPWKSMIRGYAASLADQGFTAAIPDYLATTRTPPGPAVFDAIAQNRSAWVTALGDAVDQLMTRSGVGPRHVGLLGFSLGGHVALHLRAKAALLVEFFAPTFDGIGPPGALTHAQIHHGEADRTPGTGFENAAAVQSLLKQEGTATELFGYPGAGHGFIGADRFNQDARDLSKARTLAFFQARL